MSRRLPTPILLGLLLLLLLTACQRPEGVVVNLNGQPFIRTQPQVAQGRLTPELQDADCRRFRAKGLRLG